MAAFSQAASIAESGLNEKRSPRERAIWRRETAHIYRQLVRAWIERNDPEYALALWERYRSIPVQRDRAPLEGFSLQRFLRRLDRVSVLSFVQFDDYLQGWLFDDRGVYPFRSRLSSKEAESVCGGFASLSSNTSSNLQERRSLSSRLYKTLLGPVESRLVQGRTLAIEPDGPCSGIPFEALTDRRGVYLTDRMPLMTSPGAPAVEILSNSEHLVNPSLQAVAIGDPRLEGDMAEFYPELPDARSEAFEVAALFRHGTVLAGHNATLGAVRNAFHNADLLHFSGHGVSTSDDGTLLLSPLDAADGAGLLNSESLEGSVLRCRLVVLSACQTAAGERFGPFNPQSLVQAFWRAGVPNVVATRWAVDTRVARRLIEVF
jgi:CHAT domain-containing protein